MKQEVFRLAREYGLDASKVYDLQRVIDEEDARYDEGFVSWLEHVLEESDMDIDGALRTFLSNRVGELTWR